MIDPGEIKWAAGFLEGEGCFSLPPVGTSGKPKGYYLVRANQVQRQPLERLVGIFGGHISFSPKKNPRHNDQWLWSIRGHLALQIMMTLYVQMSPKRRERIAHCLRAWKTAPQPGGGLGKTSGGYGIRKTPIHSHRISQGLLAYHLAKRLFKG